MGTTLPAMVVTPGDGVPELLHSAGGSASARAEEFFEATIENPNTRMAYRRAVRFFFLYMDGLGSRAQEKQRRPPDFAKAKKQAARLFGGLDATTSRSATMSFRSLLPAARIEPHCDELHSQRFPYFKRFILKSNLQSGFVTPIC
jgi:hypothetical protein